MKYQPAVTLSQLSLPLLSFQNKSNAQPLRLLRFMMAKPKM